MALLREMALPVKIWPMPVEVPSPIRFTEDTVHHSYDPDAANRVLADLRAGRAGAERRTRATSSANAARRIFSGARSISR